MVIALLGFGTIGAGVYEICKEQPELEVRYVLDLREVGIPELTHDMGEILADPAVDTVVEVLGGLHPAYEYAKASIEAGKHFVTANKYLMAVYYAELLALAERHGVTVRCTAAVGGGIGWLTALARAQRVEPLLAVEGIMNGTTNYILTNMTENGLPFDTALKEAQALGYAEADPTADIDGLDILNKLVLSANIAFGLSLPAEQVPVFGIRHITAEDIQTFRQNGLVCKIMGFARKGQSGAALYICPVLLPAGRPEAAVPLNYNFISFEGTHSGRMGFFGQGAGRYPTAANVVQDCVDLAAGARGFYTAGAVPAAVDNRAVERAFYLRTTSSLAQEIAAAPCGAGVRTRKISVAEMTAWMKKITADDPAAFLAAIY